MIRKQTKLWKTKSGERIRICDMKDLHLLNTIKYLHRVFDTWQDQSLLDVASAYGVCGGDMALYSVECAEQDIINADIYDEIPILYNLEQEAERRGLTA